MAERDFREYPRAGDVIVLRAARKRRTPREIIDVDPDSDRVFTSGMAGEQRNRWMDRARLSRYELRTAESREHPS